jgi:hypothetical protein
LRTLSCRRLVGRLPACAAEGLDSFRKATIELLLGADSPAIKENRVAVLQVTGIPLWHFSTFGIRACWQVELFCTSAVVSCCCCQD